MVLFDEIEKAHEDVWSILLQAMEDGTLTDAQGRKADLRNCVLILTSNVGARRITSRGRLGFSAAQTADGMRPYAEVEQAVMEDVKKTFRPEFLNRLDETVVFHQLGPAALTAITARMLEGFSLRLEAEELLSRSGFDPDYGARPLRRAIRAQVEDPAAELLLSGALGTGGTLTLTVENDQLALLPSPAINASA